MSASGVFGRVADWWRRRGETGPRHKEPAWQTRYRPWGDTRRPEASAPETDFPRREKVQEPPREVQRVDSYQWEWLREDEWLHLLLTSHTPFKGVSQEEHEQLLTTVRQIEEQLVTNPELEKYRAECYGEELIGRTTRKRVSPGEEPKPGGGSERSGAQ